MFMLSPIVLNCTSCVSNDSFWLAAHDKPVLLWKGISGLKFPCYFMHANCPNGNGNQSSFGRFRYYYVNYRTFARRQWPTCSDYDDVMLFLAECIRIFTTWQAIPFKRKFYIKLFSSRQTNV